MTPHLLILYPKLGDLAKSPRFVSAVAEDYWLNSAGPWIRIPDLVSNSDRLWRNMLKTLPDFDIFAPTPIKGLSEAQSFRLDATRTAVMCIAIACGLGLPAFVYHSMLAGNAHLKVQLSNGATCRLGRLKDVTWRGTPSVTAKTLALLNDGVTIKFVEELLCPLIGAGDNFEIEFERWKSVASLRAWDESHRTPVVLRRFDLAFVPSGYVQRYNPDDLGDTGVPYQVAAKITSPFACEALCELRRTIAPLAPSPEELIAWAVGRC